MVSHSGFVWPSKGPVECADWKATKRCGNGLHGLPMGLGDHSLLNWDVDAKWIVVEVATKDIVAIDSAKVKFPRGIVVYCGERAGAIDFLVTKGADPSKLPAGQASASGVRGQASASGDQGQASASGVRGQASASGYQGQASASGDQGQASASGDQGQASASGVRGQASASGVRGRAFGGRAGRAKAGELGILILFRHDAIANRDRAVIRYVGEEGIKADTWYRLTDADEVVECSDDAWQQLDYYARPFAAAPFACAADARALGAKP